jgi:hypothetical protein
MHTTPKPAALFHAAADHVEVARLEDLQVEIATGKQHCVQRKKRHDS